LLLACHTNCQRTFEHLDALVLSNVYVQWDPATGIEAHFQLEEFAVSVAAGLKDGYMLAGENVMQMITGGHETSLASERVRQQVAMVHHGSLLGRGSLGRSASQVVVEPDSVRRSADLPLCARRTRPRAGKPREERCGAPYLCHQPV
ncbi:MAG: hypothetical protein M3Q30_22125, partial [Actinomycetota bacterium]|nr:hypothetical protein [Actinomycetota bacterium]